MSASLFDREACEVCGPVAPPYVHAICHGEERVTSCGHLLADHSESLRCRVCGSQCGRS